MIDGCCLYIERVNRDVFPPAIAEVHLSTTERLPIFDEHQAREAERAAKLHAPCYISTGRTERETEYARVIYVLDILAESQHCYRCGAWTEKRARFFECPRCHALMLFEPAPRYIAERPTKARASLGQWTDALFALDDQTHEAYLIEHFPSEFTRSDPYLGAHSEILGVLVSNPVKPSELDGRTLKVMQTGETFTIIADKRVVNLLETR